MPKKKKRDTRKTRERVKADRIETERDRFQELLSTSTPIRINAAAASPRPPAGIKAPRFNQPASENRLSPPQNFSALR